MNGSALAAWQSDHPARMGEGNPETAAGFTVFHQRQVRLVGFTQFPGQVQAKAGSAFVGGEKRLEYGVPVFWGYTGAEILNIHKGSLAVGAGTSHQLYPVLTAVLFAVPQTVVTQVYQYLFNLAFVEPRRGQVGTAAQFNLYGGAIVQRLQEVFPEFFQPEPDIHQFGIGCPAAGQVQYVLDNAVHPPGMAPDDVQHLQVALVQVGGFFHQLGRVADGAQRVADFMGDAGGQPAQ